MVTGYGHLHRRADQKCISRPLKIVAPASYAGIGLRDQVVRLSGRSHYAEHVIAIISGAESVCAAVLHPFSCRRIDTARGHPILGILVAIGALGPGRVSRTDGIVPEQYHTIGGACRRAVLGLHGKRDCPGLPASRRGTILGASCHQGCSQQQYEGKVSHIRPISHLTIPPHPSQS